MDDSTDNLAESNHQDHVGNKLDPSLFPYVGGTPAPAAASLRAQQTPTTSLRSAKPSWHKAPGRTVGASVKRERIIVFMAGGMTYSEVREAYDLSSSLGRDIYIGRVFCHRYGVVTHVV